MDPIWFLINVLIPANLCISTGGIFQPADPLAQMICRGALGF